jgi:hypothetical protein
MQHRLLAVALGLAALLAHAGAGAKDVEGWEVARFDTGGGCYASKAVGEGVMVSFHYIPNGREFRVVVVNPNWDALVANGDQRGLTALRLTTPASPSTLSTKEGRILQLGDGDEAVAVTWPGDVGVLARNALGVASVMSISFKDKDIGTFPLQGNSRAINALIRCASGLGQY